MSIHSHLQYDQSTSHARIPAGGINLIASIDSISEAQVTASFFGSTKALHGENAIPSAETLTHNHSNQQYSVTAITTSAGAIAERYAYSAYGEPTICDGSGSIISRSAINNRYSYTGREWDATVGLHHFLARWMSTKTGRFLTRDPIGYEGSPNGLYTVFSARPLARLDSTGLIDFGCDTRFFLCNDAAEIRLQSCLDAGGGNWCYPPYYGDLAECIAEHIACKAAEAIQTAAGFCELYPWRCVLVGGVLVVGGTIVVVEPRPAGEAAVAGTCTMIVGGAVICSDEVDP